MTSSETTCGKCDQPFRGSLTNHERDFHCESFTVTYLQNQENPVKLTLTRSSKDNKFHCPFCNNGWESRVSARSHIQRRRGNCNDVSNIEKGTYSNEEETDNSVSEIESSQLTKSESSQLVKVPSNTSIANVPTATCLNSVRRNYSQAIVHACQSMNADKDEIDKNEWIIERMKLEPFSLFPLGPDGQPMVVGQSVELNGLAHRNNISELADKAFICKPILSVKRKRDVDASIDNVCPGLTSLIHRSPYRNMLLNQHYFDLDESTIRWLNTDWTTEPQMKYVCAQVLAGAVLLNTNNGEAIIINTIEIYGDTKSVDIHRALSSPSDDLYAIPSTMYSDVWPSVHNTRDGRKLTINSHSCSGLVTSSLRLDIRQDPNVGPSSFDFSVSAKSTKIFIDEKSWTKARCLALDATTRSVEKFKLIYQARQLRSHFYHPATYFLCRASSFLALHHSCQPFTIFTYADSETVKKSMNNDNSSMIASRLFQKIGYSVISPSATTSLDKEYVAFLQSQCNKGKMKQLFDDLIKLFGDNTQLSIIYNLNLNKVLQEMAAAMSSDISRANHSISTKIKSRLQTIDRDA